MSKGITSKKENYSKWYTDVIKKAELADYGPVKGTMVIRPYGYQIWEKLKNELDQAFKDSGHANAYFPLFIPKSFFTKESEHVDGFAKECAIVTHSRLTHNDDKTDLIPDESSKLEEEVIVRPTSETVIWSMYRKWINSYRDLPILINQWANVVRWEMRTRLFLRTSEFLWQEGHTAHASEDEAQEESLKILNIYEAIVKNILAIPVIKGTKTESEKFAGAVNTYTIEMMMGDKKALQAGTSHYLGQNFAKAFDVKFQDVDNKEKYVYATSWGVTTRLIGALIMVHGDEKGLCLPPNIAPIQTVFVPIFKSEEDLKLIKETLSSLIEDMKNNNVSFYFDDRKKISPGYKFNEWEIKGVPIRIEVGLRDITQKQITCVRRDTSEKLFINIKDAFSNIKKLIADIQNDMLADASNFLNSNIFYVKSYEDFKKTINNGGFVKCGWDGKEETEKNIKNDTNATIRCIPFDQDNVTRIKCIFSNKPAKYEVIFAKAY